LTSPVSVHVDDKKEVGSVTVADLLGLVCCLLVVAGVVAGVVVLILTLNRKK
jgi:hypothetical protein